MPGHAQTKISTPDGLHSEARIFSVLTHLAVTQLVLASTAVIRNKIVAVKLGPTAFGEFSQIVMVMTVVYTIVSFGMGVSLRRNAAKTTSTEERAEQLATANGMVLGLAAIAAATSLLLLGSGRLLRLAALEQHPANVIAAMLFIAAIPIEGIRNNYLALLQGVLDVRGLAVRRSIAVIVATVVAIPVVWLFGFVGAAIQFFVLSLFVAVLLGWRCHTLGYSPLQVRLGRDMAVRLASFGIASLVSGFAQAFADTAVRTSLIETAGAAPNGILQAAYALSMTVKGVVLASIGTVSLASIGAKTDRDEISASMDKLLDVVIPLGAVTLGLLGLLGAPALSLLYSSAFAPGTALLPFILSADLIFVFVWVIGAPLLAHGDRVLWVVLDLVYAGARWCIAVMLLPRMGTVAVVIGYLAAAGLHLSLNFAVCRFRYELHLSSKRIQALLVGIGLVASLSMIGASRPASIPVVFAGVGAWSVYTLRYVHRRRLFAALLGRGG